MSATLYVGPQLIPLRAISAQQVNVTLNQQSCQINLAFKSIQVPIATEIVTVPPVFEGIVPCFLDLYVNNALIVGGVLCQNNNRIVRNEYLGFIGDLAFEDTQGDEDPQVSGLGTRWQLTYWANLTTQ